MRWEYHVEQFYLPDKAKTKDSDIARVQTRLNALGNQGWELLTYVSPKEIGFGSGSRLIGEVYFLCIFKRQVATSRPPAAE
jgi:hypothetical protein